MNKLFNIINGIKDKTITGKKKYILIAIVAALLYFFGHDDLVSVIAIFGE